MGSGIYKKVTIKGQKVDKELSNREVKAYIMKVNGWTSQQYDKQYDIFKNKLRAYENYERMHTGSTTRQSPAQVLYKEARSKEREGADYSPSIKMQRIRRFTSVSSGKAGQKALLGKRYQARRNAIYEEATNMQFSGFLAKNQKAQELASQIKDPVKREKFLADYANKVHERIAEKVKEAKSQKDGTAVTAPFSGEVYGSDDPVDIDISAYLD